MKDSECIPYRETGFFSALIGDYLDQKSSLHSFYHRFPKLEEFAAQIKEKAEHFSLEQRSTLSKALREQYKDIQAEGELSTLTAANLQALVQENTFTVTTGHQLNLFTGPLYFIYKIISTINLAEQLSAAYPDKHFVPIYWMASEDHDFEEINFINLYGGKLRWQSSTGGAVGRMPNYGMGKVIDELEEHLAGGSKAKEWVDLLRKAYHEHGNLTSATRYLVNQLFGEYGLVIIDGDDALLKRSMIPAFERDLFQHPAKALVEEQSERLKDDYFAQVFPREINLFYLQDGHRNRIERKGEAWLVLNTELSFTESELRAELQSHPERFSPNVILRPLYQETILPNLAYIGGGGELAYWFQLKGFFDREQVVFPMLVLRNSVLWVEKKWQNRMSDLEMSTADFFKPLSQIKEDYLKDRMPVDPSLSPYEQEIERIFNDLEEIAQLTDESMLGAVNAQRQKQLNGIANLRKKLVRAEKRRHAELMEKIERIHYGLFPMGALQERYDTLSPYYSAHGKDFIQALKEDLDPLDFRFRILYA